MEALAAAIGLVLVALSAFLTVLAWMASRRFTERRILLLAIAFLLVWALAVLAVIAELDVTSVKWFDETFALEPVPSTILLVALTLIYVAMGVRGNSPGVPGDGGH